MSQNPMFVLGPPLQDYFVDKNTGLPLANGLVYFYRAIDPMVLKPVFQITGAPPNYSFIQLPNPIVLSGVGTIQDQNGNDVLYYFFPYDDMGNFDQYFIVVTDQFGSIQFTREGLPSPSAGVTPTPPGVTQTNFAPNGQFLLHNNFNNPSPPTLNYGGTGALGTMAVQTVAPGGFTFEKPTTSVATDVFSFQRFNFYQGLPTGSPRYAFQLNRTVPSPDLACDLRIKFNDVNKFQGSNNLIAFYTFQFWAQAMGSPINGVNIYVIDYYGSGATPLATETLVGAANPIQTQWGSQLVTFAFPVTAMNSVGDNDDDFVQIAIRFPGSTTFNVEITDIMLFEGTLPTGGIFPTTTNGEFVLEALSNLAPTSNPESPAYYAEDGSNLYLPVIMTPSGFTYDYSQIGKINAAVYKTPGKGELLCDGSTYVTSQYSTDGIPYARLQSVLYNSTINMPIYGTGSNAGASSIGASASPTENYLLLSTLSTTPTNPNDSGFTITQLTTGGNYFVNASVYITATGIGSVGTYPNPGSVIPNAQDTGGNPTGFTIQTEKNSLSDKYFFQIFSTTLPPQNSSFLFSSVDSVGAVHNWQPWYNLGDSGTGPTPVGGYTLIPIIIPTGSTLDDLISLTSIALNGRQMSQVTTSPTPTSGSFWTYFAPTQQYFVWYNVNGAGPLPIASGLGIKVDILSTSTQLEIAQATMLAINNFTFGVPDLRGYFLRGWDNGSPINPFAPNGLSFGTNGLYFGDNIGTTFIDTYQTHNHGGQLVGNMILASAGTPSTNVNLGTAFNAYGYVSTGGIVPNSVQVVIPYDGYDETAPVYSNVNYVIKY